MPVFFDGRLWVSPATMSKVDDSAMFNRGLSVGNVLALVGRSEGGAPGTAIRLGGPQDARKILRSGDGLKAVEKAFDPSSQTGAPAEVIFVRVNPAVQAALVLNDSTPAPVISLAATDYGLYTNQIKVKVEAATTRGLKLSTQLGEDYYTQDDVYRDAFSVQYLGAQASAVMSITGTSLVLQAPSGTTVATVDLNAYPTVQQVVDRINAVASFTASVLDGNANKPTLNGLDYVSVQDVKTAVYTAKADLQAAVDWFNGQGEGFITAVRAPAVGKPPAALNWTYLSGGTDGTVTNTEWADAFDEVLQNVDCQWVVPLSGDASIHAMADSHVAYMSSVARMERRSICGTVSGVTDAAAIAAAKALNSDRTSLTHLGFYDYDQSGALTLFEPYILAALLAGAFSGSNPGTALTNKALKIRGLERKLRNPTDTDRLLTGGVLCLEDTQNGYKVVQSISTWLVNDNYNRVEVSCGVAVDFVARNVRNALDVLRGEKANAITLGRAVNIAESTLRELARQEPQGPGVLAGDETSPPYKNIVASIDGDVLRVEFQCSPVIPVNYIPVTIFAVPYSGTASA
jgi:hypothetical protein